MCAFEENERGGGNSQSMFFKGLNASTTYNQIWVFYMKLCIIQSLCEYTLFCSLFFLLLIIFRIRSLIFQL